MVDTLILDLILDQEIPSSGIESDMRFEESVCKFDISQTLLLPNRFSFTRLMTMILLNSLPEGEKVIERENTNLIQGQTRRKNNFPCFALFRNQSRGKR